MSALLCWQQMRSGGPRDRGTLAESAAATSYPVNDLIPTVVAHRD